MEITLKRIKLTNFKKFSGIDIQDIKINDLNLITGVNNSGKTTVLHALAVWEFAKILLINFRGTKSLTARYSEDKKGLGISPETFSPINIPSLKYLWKDQKTNGSYGMKIKVFWDDETGKELYLEIAFTLNGNNFAIKKSDSNLTRQDSIPTIAYLPPFGGMTQFEPLLSMADRKKLIGKGQAGAVIRNLLLDLHNEHENIVLEARNSKFPGRKRLGSHQKSELLQVPTAWRHLKDILQEVFHVNLYVQQFDSSFHNFINIDVFDVIKNYESLEFEKDKSSKRDLMIEGSGFLQWLSVFTLALDKNNDVLLLDEPDAHLHSTLQSILLTKLQEICDKNKKQILMVSHSPELIKLLEFDKILYIQENKADYLNNSEQKVLVLEGLGSKYFPLLDQITRNRRVLLVENNSDTRLLMSACSALGFDWPENLVEWITNKKHKERKTLIIELNQKILQQTGDHLVAYSLRDLDDDNYGITDSQLKHSGWPSVKDDSGTHEILHYRTLRRREIENYLIIPTAISRYISANCNNPEIPKDVDAVMTYLTSEHGLVVPNEYRQSERTCVLNGLFNNDVKPVLDGINKHFKVKFNKDDYIAQIEADEYPDDIRLIVNELIRVCEE